MDDLTEMLSGVLNSPEGMEKLKSLASGLLGEEKQKKKEEENSIDLFGDISPQDIAGIMSIIRQIKSKENDKRTNLILSLKPHLSEERQKRADDAVKILRLISLLPVIKNSGIFQG